MEAARVIAGLVRVVRDVGLAEDLAQDALVAALEQWPESGVPDNPGAWLMSVARRRGVDAIRRRVTLERKVELIGRDLTADAAADDPMDEIEFEPAVHDDVLRLMFTACHPVLAPEARVALTLRMIGGLTTEEIARAFVVPVPTMAARITRAKKALADAGVPFEIPVGAGLAARLASVLDVVYLVFNEGYTATSGSAWTRPALCDEAMRLGRMLCGLAPGEPEAFALVALMEIQASRLRARVTAAGEPVTLADQDRSRWDRVLINHALAALARAVALGGVRAVLPAGLDRRLPRPRDLARDDRLGHDRLDLRDPGGRVGLADRRAQPRRRGVDGVGADGGPGDRRRPAGSAGPEGLPPAAERARRPAVQARPPGRGADGVRGRGRAHRQRAGARAAARPRGCLLTVQR